MHRHVLERWVILIDYFGLLAVPLKMISYARPGAFRIVCSTVLSSLTFLITRLIWVKAKQTRQNENLFALDPFSLLAAANAFGSTGTAYTGTKFLLRGQFVYHKDTRKIS